MPDLSIIVVNWNARDLLAKCLRCVQETVKTTRYEVFVVDNASTDGSMDMVREQFPGVRLIVNSDNVGFAGANNQAMRQSEARYTLLLNSDAFVKDGTIDRMAAFMDEHPEAGMAGCRLRYGDGRLQPSCTSFPTLETEFYTATGLSKLFRRSRVFGKYMMTYWNFDDLREVDSIMGAFMLVRAEAIQQVGLMDESYFMYSEEVDWCYRFKKAGWKIYFVPEVETVHLWGGSAAQVAVKMHVQMYRSRVMFFRKHYGRPSALLFKALIGISCVVRIVPAGLLYLITRRPGARHKLESWWRLLRALPGF